MDNLKLVNELHKITLNVVFDYFQRLGGSGQYLGFEKWHCYALVLIVSLKIDKDILTNNRILPALLPYALFDKTDNLLRDLTESINALPITSDVIKGYLESIDNEIEHPEKHMRLHELEFKKWFEFRSFISKKF